jgi:hypothetical protein
MSIVHLTSVGQKPNQFSNFFSNGIQLGANSEVALIGYSGNLAGEENSVNAVYEIVIQQGINDKFSVLHGDVSVATGSQKDLYYAPVEVKLGAGIYTPASLGIELDRVLNESERISHYKGGWEVTYDPAAFKYTIKCGTLRGPPLAGGSFVNYINGGSSVADGVLNAAGQTTLNPYQAGPPILTTNAFIDTTPGYLGDTAIGAGVIGTGLGYHMEFTTIGATTNTDIGYSLCMVAKQNASRMEFSQPNSAYPQNSPTVWGGDMTPSLDFAFGPGGPELFGFCPHGITINPADGRFGIIEAKTQNIVGDPKDPANFNITWTATNVNVAAPGLKKMAICPKMSAVNDPIIEYWADNGAGWVLLATRIISGSQDFPVGGGDNATYRYSQNYYMGVLCNAPVVTSPTITAKRSPNPVALPIGLPINPDEPVVFAWSPLDDNIDPLVNNDLVSQSGLWESARTSNKLGQSLGFPAYINNVNAAVAWAVGITSLEAVGEATNNGEYSPLLITCPSLPIQGYIGGANGSTSALLGVGRVRGNELSYGFSSEVAENWVQLRNKKPITLYQLAIDIKTETNNDYIGLEPNFSCWLKFRSDAHCIHPKQNDVVGIISN